MDEPAFARRQFDSLEWDENKRLSNIEKHYRDFLDAVFVFQGPYLHLQAKTVRGEVRGAIQFSA